METLIMDKDLFKEKIQKQIFEGKHLLQLYKKDKLSSDQFEDVYSSFKLWTDFNKELLKQSFSDSNSSYRKEFIDSGAFFSGGMIDVQRGLNPESYEFRFKHFKSKIEPKIKTLESIFNRIDLMQSESPEQKKSSDGAKSIFVSHASIDSTIVEKIIEVLETIGVKEKSIFCTSFKEYGIMLGDNFLDTIKNKLNEDVIVIFVLTENFYRSPICLCEMGATWIKTSKHIPIVVPPLDFSDVKGVIPLTQGFKLDDKTGLNQLKELIEKELKIPSISINLWERKRDKIHSEFIQTINNKENTQATQNVRNTVVENPDIDSLLKKLAVKEWPDDYVMQEDYIKTQKMAYDRIRTYSPSGISQDEFNSIQRKAVSEWPDDYTMQLDHIENQIDSLKRLKEN